MNLGEINRHVIALCQQTGEFIGREGQSFDRSRIEQKQDFNNLVSYVDKESERMLVAELSKILPKAGFITEEKTVEQSHDQEYNWIIDPLDGTTNFLHGLPMYAISIGLAHKNKPILGAIYDITRQQCYHAVADQPAYLDDQEIRVSNVASLHESLLATGFPYYHSDKRDDYLDIIKDFLNETHGIRRLGSAAMDLAFVACGKLEGFFEYNLNPWDIAGGIVIVQQAGGKVSDFSGGDDFLFGKQLCASNAAIHDEMIGVIAKRWF